VNLDRFRHPTSSSSRPNIWTINGVGRQLEGTVAADKAHIAKRRGFSRLPHFEIAARRRDRHPARRPGKPLSQRAASDGIVVIPPARSR